MTAPIPRCHPQAHPCHARWPTRGDPCGKTAGAPSEHQRPARTAPRIPRVEVPVWCNVAGLGGPKCTGPVGVVRARLRAYRGAGCSAVWERAGGTWALRGRR